MKKSALQLARMMIQEEKQSINGNIAEHMILSIYSNDNNFYIFLTDEEIEEMNGNSEKWHEHGEEVFNLFRNNFDYDIKDFEYSYSS